MLAGLDLMLPTLFGFAALGYLWLALRVSRAVAHNANNSISYFLFLIGAFVAGSALAFSAKDTGLFAIGRTLTVFASGFLALVLYKIYRDYTVGGSNARVLAALSVIPAISTLLAISNPLHHLMWMVVEADAGTHIVDVAERLWFKRVHAPFAYALIGYSITAMFGRLPTIARAHRRKITLFLVSTAVPFAVSAANNLLGIGPPDVPFAAIAVSLLLPLYWWVCAVMRIHEFSPLAYQTMFDHVRDPIIVLDKSQRIISANQPAQDLLKSPEEELVGQRLWNDLPEAQAMLNNVGDRDLTQTVRMESDRYFELNSTPLKGPAGQDQGTVVVCRDVTKRKRALRALADSEHLIRTLVEHSSNGILRFSRDTLDSSQRFRCTFANNAAERYLASGSGTLVGLPLEKMEQLDAVKLSREFSGEKRSMSGISYEIELETDDGDVWLRVIGEPVGADFSVTLIDITQRKHIESRILADALRDPLTGVLNRRGFEKEAAASIATYEQGAVLYLDLNEFKLINDRFGHQTGDAVLKAFANRLGFCLRPEDILARLGGDEFTIVLPDVSVGEARHVAERLVETAADPYIIHGQEIECAASVGIALVPKHGNELWELVCVADKAMYNAKSLGEENVPQDRAAYVEAAIAS